MRKRAGGMFSKSWGKISTGIATLAFFQQLTEKDMHGTENMDVAGKAKVFINTVTGRLFGIGVVPGMSHPPQTFNFAGIFNKWTGLGAGLYLYGKASPFGPHKGKAGTLGKALLTGGILGGFFDAPGDRNEFARPTQHQFNSNPRPMLNQSSGMSTQGGV